MMMQFKKPIILFFILCFAVASAYVFLKQASAPNITFTTIRGQKMSMASLQNKVVLVSFWATDCTSCNKEMPEMVNVYKDYKSKGFEIIAVAMPYDPPAQLQNYVTQKRLPFPVVHDGYGDVTAAFGGIDATPTAFLFGKQGKRLNHTIGILDFKRLRNTLDKELS
jgi:peroxiredoxin